MTNLRNKFLSFAAAAALAGAVVFAPGSASAVTLDNWGNAELEASSDTVEVTISVVSGNTVFSVIWVDGGGTGPDGIGIDFFSYNIVGPIGDGDVDPGEFGSIFSVFTNSVDVTANWTTLNDDNLVQDGFGAFNSGTNHDPSGPDGISHALVFTLMGTVTLTPNAEGGTLVAHVRYGLDCSGWVSDGTHKDAGNLESISDCDQNGNGEDPPNGVPEPGTLLIFGAGLLGLAYLRRRRAA